MSFDLGLHHFVAGSDRIERCALCRMTRSRKGMIQPVLTPCPILSRLSGWIDAPTTGRLTPFDAAVWDEILAPEMLMDFAESRHQLTPSVS